MQAILMGDVHNRLENWFDPLHVADNEADELYLGHRGMHRNDIMH